MRVILTGGTGMVGRALAEDLAGDGHEVVVLSRSPDRQRSLFSSGVQVLGWDARTANGWGHLADGAGAIVNLAGAPLPGPGFFPWRWNDERRRVIRESRVNAGRAVVEAVESAATKPGVVIQASAIGYYGPNPPGEQTPDSPPGSDFAAQVCVEWEAATAPVEALGVRRAVVRTGLILDPKQGALLRLLLPFRMFVGGPMGSGKQWMAWIHPRDETRALRYLIDNPQAVGAFNLTAPNPVTNRTFARTLGRVLGRPSLIPVPGFALRLAFGEVATIVLDGQKAIPARLQELGFNFDFTELEPALRDVLGKS